MQTSSRRSGLALVLVGLLGVLFFWLTDPRYGLAQRWGSAENLIEDANEAWIGTLVGVAGSLVVLGIGLWLASRKRA